MRTVLLACVILAVAIVGGAGSVQYALDAQSGVGAVNVGVWTAFPDAGTPDADPYSKARVARDGALTLGRAEGLAFTASRDSAGERLRRECAYSVEGTAPPSRFWTLHAVDEQSALVPTGSRRAPAMHSLAILRRDDDSFAIAVAPKARPGNWLATSGTGPMALVLSLYDTPIAASTGVAGIVLPQVVRTGCDA